MISFLVPAFLAGLIAIGIPLLIHLRQKQRREPVPFPSLMFLRQLPHPAVKKRRIRDWWLLALRAAAVILLVLAFARPFLPNRTASAAGTSVSRDVVILLDRSWSMGHGDAFERARAAARGVIDGLGTTDRIGLVLFDRTAEAALHPTDERARLRGALDQARPGSEITRYGPAIKLAETLLADSDRGRRDVILISDFQKGGWEADASLRLPAGVSLTTVSVADPDAANRALTGLTFTRERAQGRERVSVTARLANLGTGDARTDATLEVDGRPVQTLQAEVPARGGTRVTFAPFVLPDAPTRITVKATPDDLPTDDTFHAVLEPGQSVGVLVVDGASGRRNASLYLRSALELGDRPRHDVAVVSPTSLTEARLAQTRVVILNDAPWPGGAAGRALRAWVESGGGLFVSLGDGAAWPRDGAGLLPGAPRAPTDRPRGGTLAWLDLDHPALEAFKQPRSGDLTTARFHRYRALETDSASAVLARFDDGAPALLERRVGEGRVLIWTSTLDTYWNDLARQPVFLPLVHQAVRHLAAWQPRAPWRVVGEAATAALAVTEPGFHEVEQPEEGAGDPSSEASSVIALNVDRSESDLAALDPNEVATAVAGPEATDDGPMLAAAGTAPAPETQERRQSVWWYLIVAAFLLLAIETVLANRRAHA